MTELAAKNAQCTCVYVHYLGNTDVTKKSNNQYNGANLKKIFNLNLCDPLHRFLISLEKMFQLTCWCAYVFVFCCCVLYCTSNKGAMTDHKKCENFSTKYK